MISHRTGGIILREWKPLKETLKCSSASYQGSRKTSLCFGIALHVYFDRIPVENSMFTQGRCTCSSLTKSYTYTHDNNRLPVLNNDMKMLFRCRVVVIIYTLSTTKVSLESFYFKAYTLFKISLRYFGLVHANLIWRQLMLQENRRKYRL